MSGIFRDSFANVVELLDAMFVKAAAAEEPEEMNYIKKHAAEMQAKVRFMIRAPEPQNSKTINPKP
jgi:cobalamin biosynthesis Mg chelatase CobN